MSKLSVRFVSLGCSKNLVDSEVMMGSLQEHDFEIVSPDEASDVGVINTCGFIDAAKKESIDTIMELALEKKAGRLKLLVVAGCLSQRYAEELPKLIPEVDAFIGTGDFAKLSEVIQQKLKGSKERNFIRKPTMELPSKELPRVHTTPFYYRYLKVSEGCSHSCSFCTIPLMRGGLQSRGVADILSEMKMGVNEGVKEFNLIAQDLNEYGRDLKDRDSLYNLLKQMGNIDGNFWVRLLYMYPLQFPDKLIKLIKDHPHIIPYVDIPLQHINDAILKSMKRGSSSKYIYRLLEMLQKEIPEIVLRTTFILGYPGEGDKEFGQLLKFIREIQFDRLGVFTFSYEEGTPSSLLPNQVPQTLKEERQKILMEVQQGISAKKHKKLIGKTFDVIYESPIAVEEKDMFPGATGVGRYFGQAPEIDGETFIKFKKGAMPEVGSLIKVKITDAKEYDLVGESLETVKKPTPIERKISPSLPFNV